MPVNDLIILRKGTDAVWSGINPVLSSGEPGYDSTYNLLKVGNGTSSWSNLNPVNLSGTYFNNAVSGLLPVKNIIAGTDISISSNNGNYTINSTSSGGAVSAEDVMDIIGTGIVAGTGLSVSYNDNDGNLTINLYAVAITGYEILTTAKDTFTVTPNYLVGNLQVYYNGFKLLDGEDYTATNGTSFLLNSPGASGDVVEWAGLGGPAQYAQLNHTHTISDITNFGSGVSGLLPTIANSGDNRILTSTGSTLGINAEANLTFNGSLLNVSGSGTFASGVNISNQIGSTIASFNSSKNLVSLTTDEYPSLTELSYVKDVTSALQTQINSKAANSTTITAGSGLAGGGNLAANRTIDIGQGDGITVSADSIAVDSTVIRTTGVQTMSAVKTFSAQTVFASGTAAAPGISILGDTDTGLCQISSVGTNSLSISTSGVERVRFTSDGTTQVRANSSNISTLFTYNENGGELVHYDDAQAAATLLDQCNNQTRLLELINGSDLLLGLGGSNTTGSVRFMRAGFIEIMRINSSGNIGIGSSTNNDNIRTRLQVCGPDADDDPSLGSGTGALLVTNSDSAYGMQFGVSSDGVGWIQQGRVDGTATAYNLLLNPVGGNVGIGTSSPGTKLQINGQTRVTDGTTNIDFISSSGFGYIGTQTNHSLVLRTNDTEKMRITAAGNVGIGGTAAATPPELLSVMQDNNAGRTSILIDNLDQRLKMSCYYEGGVGQYSEIQSTNNAETSHQGLILNRQGGNVAIGTATASYRLHVVGNASATNNVVCYLNNTGGTRSRLAFQDTAVTYAPDMGSVGNSLTFDTVGVERVRVGNNGRTQFFAATEKYGVQLNNGSTGNGPFIGSDGADIFCISSAGGAERVRVDANGNVCVNSTGDTNPAGSNVAGACLSPGGYLSLTRNSDNPLLLNRKTNDGTLTTYQQDGTTEGSISVSNNTVSYNAFCGSHWAQLIDGSRPAILRGTVLETIDEMCEWPGEPKNDRLPRVKISDTPRSRRVYGVFMGWDEDDTATGDMYCTALGAYMVRVSGVVQSGDLLESAGDGTARSQSDDIIRSSTIGKVSSTHRITEYDDGSYLVPCVLMCG